MSYWKRWFVIVMILVLLVASAALWALAAKRGTSNNPSSKSVSPFKQPKTDSGLAYPPADLTIVQEIQADLNVDGDPERVILGYRQIDNDGTEAYLSIFSRATSGSDVSKYHEIYRDYLGSDADGLRLVPSPEYYYRQLDAFRDLEEKRGKNIDIRVSRAGLMVMASDTGWDGSIHGLNAEMVVWDVAKHQFKRIFAVGARQGFPLVEHVQLLDIDLDCETEIVVFSTTSNWIDPKAKHVFRIYKWSSKQKRYVLVSPDRPLKTLKDSGWISR